MYCGINIIFSIRFQHFFLHVLRQTQYLKFVNKSILLFHELTKNNRKMHFRSKEINLECVIITSIRKRKLKTISKICIYGYRKHRAPVCWLFLFYDHWILIYENKWCKWIGNLYRYDIMLIRNTCFYKKEMSQVFVVIYGIPLFSQKKIALVF